MIKILKPGTIPQKIKRIYSVKCYHCGCEFEFDKTDCLNDQELKGFITINCPCCGAEISGRFAYDFKFKDVVEDTFENPDRTPWFCDEDTFKIHPEDDPIYQYFHIYQYNCQIFSSKPLIFQELNFVRTQRALIFCK